MGWMTAAAIVGSSLIGADSAGDASSAQVGASAASSAAQERMTDKQIAAQKEMFERQIALQEPWRKAGVGALNKLIPLSNYKKFGMDTFEEDPGYAFRLSEGQKALDRQAASRGGLISGSALKDALRFGQEMGSQEYTNAFNRYGIERDRTLNPLQSLAGVGQTATNQMSSAAGQYGAGVSNAYGNLGNALGANAINAGNARASGYIGQSDALNQGLSQYLKYNQNQNYLNMMGQNNIMSGLQTPEGISNYFSAGK